VADYCVSELWRSVGDKPRACQIEMCSAHANAKVSSEGHAHDFTKGDSLTEGEEGTTVKDLGLIRFLSSETEIET